MKNQSKRIQFPNFKYLDAKFHPEFKDHVIVLSTNEFPDNVNMTYCWDQHLYGISGLDTSYPEQFANAVKEIEESKKTKEKGDKREATPKLKTLRSSALDHVNELIEETKGIDMVSDSEKSYDYEGGEGESDEEVFETKKTKNKRKEKENKKEDKKKDKKPKEEVKKVRTLKNSV
jgi:hypothetical protein